MRQKTKVPESAQPPKLGSAALGRHTLGESWLHAGGSAKERVWGVTRGEVEASRGRETMLEPQLVSPLEELPLSSSPATTPPRSEAARPDGADGSNSTAEGDPSAVPPPPQPPQQPTFSLPTAAYATVPPSESAHASEAAHASRPEAASECATSGSSGGAAAAAGEMPPITARINSTCNQLDDEPWLPVRGIVTMFRIEVQCGDKRWEQLRRYTDFFELDAQLAKSFDPAMLPGLPPKLMVNEDAAIATRFLELDAYVRGLLAHPSIGKHARVLDFLGVEKHGPRYGVRRYEYDSAHSEGNRYIRDTDL